MIEKRFSTQSWLSLLVRRNLRLWCWFKSFHSCNSAWIFISQPSRQGGLLVPETYKIPRKTAWLKLHDYNCMTKLHQVSQLDHLLEYRTPQNLLFHLTVLSHSSDSLKNSMCIEEEEKACWYCEALVIFQLLNVLNNLSNVSKKLAIFLWKIHHSIHIHW